MMGTHECLIKTKDVHRLRRSWIVIFNNIIREKQQDVKSLRPLIVACRKNAIQQRSACELLLKLDNLC